MAEKSEQTELNDQADDPRTERRRQFLQSAAKVAVTTPVVTLMLAAGTKRTVQAGPYGLR